MTNRGVTRGNWSFNERSQSRSFSSLTCIMAKNSSRRFQMKPNQSITWVGIQTDLLLLATIPSSAKLERVASAAKRAVFKSCSQSAPSSKCKNEMKTLGSPMSLLCDCSTLPLFLLRSRSVSFSAERFFLKIVVGVLGHGVTFVK